MENYMKRISVTLAVCMVLAVGAMYAGESIKFITNDWNKARTEAKQSNKYLFVDAYTDWCYWCKVMDKKTFPDESVAAFMNKHFVAAKLEMEHDYGINVAMKYRVNSFPTFLVFSPDGKLVYKISGYHEVQPFIDELKKALEPQRLTTYNGISTNVDLDFPEFYGAAFGTKGKRAQPDSATVNGFIAKQTDLFSEVNYSVQVRFASLLSPQNRDQLFKNANKYAALYGPEEIEQAGDMVAYGYLNKAIKNKSESELQQCLEFITKNKAKDVDMTKSFYCATFYKSTNEWTKMAEHVDKYIGFGNSTNGNINEWSWAVYEGCNDQTVIAKAIRWMTPVVEHKEEYATMDTYAALLFKAKRIPEAKKYATRAIELGKAAGEKTEETEKLLKKMTTN